MMVDIVLQLMGGSEQYMSQAILVSSVLIVLFSLLLAYGLYLIFASWFK